jgi:hypothetical protein
LAIWQYSLQEGSGLQDFFVVVEIPANRFYEAVSYDIVMFYDINCKNTFEKYGVKIDDDFWIDSVKDLKAKAKVKFYKDFLLKQRKLKEYAFTERIEFEKEAKKIFSDILFKY